MRRMSSASRPSGVRPCSSPASQIASQTAGPSEGWHQTSYPSSPVYPVRETTIGIPSYVFTRPTVRRNHLRSSNDVCVGGVQTIFSSSFRLSGPCTATLCSCSVEGFTQTLSSLRSASSFSQIPSYSSPPTKRKLSWPSR